MFDRALIASPIGNGAAQGSPRDWSWKDILIIVAIGVIANLLIIAIPGFYSHDELDWQNRIARNDYPWSFGLGTSPRRLSSGCSARLSFRRRSGFLYNPSRRILPTFCWPSPPRASSIAPLRSSGRTAPLPRPFFSCSCRASPIRPHGSPPGLTFSLLFWGSAYIFCAVQYWRGGHPAYLIAALAAFVIALGCKETALSIPICAALVLFIDRDRVDRRRVAILAALTGGLIVVYLALGAARILRMSASGEGGYRFGDGSQVFKNLVAYFGFPFAPELPKYSCSRLERPSGAEAERCRILS